ncbi:MAG TPA: hypothetical protein PKH07_13210, partial [bacterium]|nr:hypothetical protein [bacterium]
MKTLFLIVVVGLFLCVSMFASAEQVETSVAQVQTSLRGVDGVVDAYGGLHLAWIDGGTLQYATSYDDGKSWYQYSINTPRNGTYATRMGGLHLAIDPWGNAFMFTNVYFGNAGYGQEFFYKIYCITNVTGVWQEEVVVDYLTYFYRYDSAGDFYLNNLANPFDAFSDAQGNIHLFLRHFGWWSYGGELFEKVRSAGSTGAWGGLTSICHIYHPNVDFQSSIYEQAIQTSDGGAVVIALNRDGNTNTSLPVQNQNRFVYYLERAAGGAWSNYQPFSIGDNYEGSKGFMNIDVDEGDNIHVLHVQPGFANLLYTRNWGTPELVATVPTANDRFNTCLLDAQADGLLTVGYTLYNTATSSYTRYPSLIERDGAGPWSPPVAFSDRVQTMTPVTGVARFDTYLGGSYEGPLRWLCWGPAAYPLSLVYLQDEPRKPEPDFEIKLVDPVTLYTAGEQPQFRVTVLPKNGFNQEVNLFLHSEYPPARLTADTVLPPAVTTVLGEQIPEVGESTEYHMFLTADSSDGRKFRDLFIPYQIFYPIDEMSALSLNSGRETIRVGETLPLSGRLLPGLEQ